MRVHEIVEHAARRYRGRIALRQGRAELSHEDLDRLVTGLSRQLVSRGFGGRHGAVFIDNSVEYVVAYFAIARADGVVIPIPTALPPGRAVRELSFCDASFLVTTPRYASLFQELFSRTGEGCPLIVVSCSDARLETEVVPFSSGMSPASAKVTGRSADAAVLLRTSGTASHPKWVVLSHRNVTANMSAFLSRAALDDTETGLITLPLTSAGTHTTEMLAYLACGITSILYPHPTFVLGEFCRTIAEERVTIANVTPFVLGMLLWKAEEAARMTASLRKVFFASAPIASARFQQLLDAFPHVQFYRGYGLTEASPRCTMLSPQLAHSKIESSGSPLDGVSIRIVDDAGRAVGTGETGEITVKGPNVMPGYYDQADDTAAVLKGGWLHTGDYGRVDDQGLLYVRGRKKNIVITKGINVCPEEVEQEIMACPDVRDACVSGVHDEELGESLVAHVVPTETARLSEAQLKAFLRERLEPAKVPGRIVFVGRLPRNHAFKLVRDPRFLEPGANRISSTKDPLEA